MRILAGIAFLLLQGARKEVVVEKSEPLKGGGGLGTMGYPETSKEGPFLKKVNEKRVDFWSELKIPKPASMTRMDYGKDRTNPKWLELRKVAGDKAYAIKTSDAYYEERLGKRESPK
jgi:hypothetical protein